MLNIIKEIHSKSIISSSLDQIWQLSPNLRKDHAKRILNQFSYFDWSLLGFITINSILNDELNVYDISFDPYNQFKVFLGPINFQLVVKEIRQVENDELLVLEFRDFNRFVYFQGVSSNTLKEYNFPVIKDPIQILLAMSYLKHNFDSIVFMPNKIKIQILEDLSGSFEIPIKNLLLLDTQMRKYFKRDL